MINSRSRRSLVVEDDLIVLDVIQTMLDLNDCAVTSTNDAGKALDLIEAEEFDIVLTGLAMPVVTGWTIAEKVKQKNPKTRVVLITAWGFMLEKTDLSKRGVDLLISKPFRYEAFRDAINTLLGPVE